MAEVFLWPGREAYREPISPTAMTYQTVFWHGMTTNGTPFCILFQSCIQRTWKKIIYEIAD